MTKRLRRPAVRPLTVGPIPKPMKKSGALNAVKMSRIWKPWGVA